MTTQDLVCQLFETRVPSSAAHFAALYQAETVMLSALRTPPADPVVLGFATLRWVQAARRNFEAAVADEETAAIFNARLLAVEVTAGLLVDEAPKEWCAVQGSNL